MLFRWASRALWRSVAVAIAVTPVGLIHTLPARALLTRGQPRAPNRAAGKDLQDPALQRVAGTGSKETPETNFQTFPSFPQGDCNVCGCDTLASAEGSPRWVSLDGGNPAGTMAMVSSSGVLRAPERPSDCNIEPPASPYAIMRRDYPYRGENSGPGMDDRWRA